MSNDLTNKATIVVIGASHAGVACAFALRKEGWEGKIILYDSDPELPYHKPPLSKTYLTGSKDVEATPLKAKDSYEIENIQLCLHTKVLSLNPRTRTVKLNDGKVQSYDKLILATGVRPIVPPISGLENLKHIFYLRSVADVEGIRLALETKPKSKVVVIGGGYVGLEIAASLKKLGSDVIVLEREERILTRVTTATMSKFFEELHAINGVKVLSGKTVNSIKAVRDGIEVICSDSSVYPSDIVIVGVGVRVNTELAEEAGLVIENGIKVDTIMRTSNPEIYAIGDCTFHYNTHYDRYLRLECVQNALEQAKIAASAICGKAVINDAIPWFWSDQYDVKLQMVGLYDGYDNSIVRKEEKKQPCFSIWYFKGNKLLSVVAINNARAYVYGTRFIKANEAINKVNLADPSIELNPDNLV